MRILMDADCLIKLSKAGLKGVVCNNEKVFISTKVREEAAGKDILLKYSEAEIIEKNINAGKIIVLQQKIKYRKGDEEIIAEFNIHEFDVIATDDKRLIKRLNFLNIPYIIPVVLLYHLYNMKKINKNDLLVAFKKISRYVDSSQIDIVSNFLGEDDENTNEKTEKTD